tara:strand:+ start:9685 stop:9951 length:267 start_codon:yes stop_codon:yes gene_type:complete
MKVLKLTEKRKQWILRIVMRFFYIDGYCKTCVCKLDNGYHGKKKGLRWIKWCHKCYGSNFINQVASSPMALAKYYEIYGNHPKDVMPH